MRRYELSDTQWDEIEDLFPSDPFSRGRPRRADRHLLNAILGSYAPVQPSVIYPSVMVLGKPPMIDSVSGNKSASSIRF
jgi:hypothetical protein